MQSNQIDIKTDYPSTKNLLALTKALAKASMHREAIKNCDTVIASYPNSNLEEWFILKANCQKKLNQLRDANRTFREGIEKHPKSPLLLNGLGLLLKESGNTKKAIKCFKKATENSATAKKEIFSANLASSYLDEGDKALKDGNAFKASKTYMKAINLHPSSDGFYKMALIFRKNEMEKNCINYLRKSLAIDPNNGDALNLMAQISTDNGEIQNAILLYRKSFQIRENEDVKTALAKTLSHSATIEKYKGNLKEAETIYKQALYLNHACSKTWYNLGVLYAMTGRNKEAQLHYKTALTHNPNCKDAYNNLGVIEEKEKSFRKALSYYKKALEIDPLFVHGLNNSAVIHINLGDLSEAEKLCRKALVIDPQYMEAMDNLAVILRERGSVEIAIGKIRNRLSTPSLTAEQNLLLLLNYSTVEANEKIVEEHLDWGRRMESQCNSLEKKSPHKKMKLRKKNTAERRIRLGYVSADLFTHSVSYFIEAPLKFADRGRFEVFVYCNSFYADEKTDLLKGMVDSKLGGNWRNVAQMNAAELFDCIRRDQIDILVDLSGHTAGNCLETFAMKPAEVQVTWIGYPNTTGLQSMDYRIVDGQTDPKSDGIKGSETLIRMPEPFAFLCYTPPESLPPLKPLPLLLNDFITFGSFNTFPKLNFGVVKCWAEILLECPNSRLVLKCKSFSCGDVVKEVRDRFLWLGIGEERVSLFPLMDSNREHLQLYNDIDIALDSFPYNGTTTTCEALLMGVPVITYCGKTHCHRVSNSLLKKVGLDKLVTHSKGEYIKTAVRLAKDQNELEGVRRGLRRRFLDSKICDGAGFVKTLEDEVYKKIKNF